MTLTPTTRVEVDKKGRHYVLPDGTILPSVTNILSVVAKPALIPWAANCERELCTKAAVELYDMIRETKPMPKMQYINALATHIGSTKGYKIEQEKALRIGTETHALIEWQTRKFNGQVVGEQPNASEEALIAYTAWQEWIEEAKLTPIFIEQTVFSLAYGFAGTLDVMYKDIMARNVIVDYKTSKSFYDDMWMQPAALWEAFDEMQQGPVDRAIIVRLPKVKGQKAEAREMENPTDAFEGFLAALRLWKYLQRVKSYDI